MILSKAKTVYLTWWRFRTFLTSKWDTVLPFFSLYPEHFYIVVSLSRTYPYETFTITLFELVYSGNDHMPVKRL